MVGLPVIFIFIFNLHWIFWISYDELVLSGELGKKIFS